MLICNVLLTLHSVHKQIILNVPALQLKTNRNYYIPHRCTQKVVSHRAMDRTTCVSNRVLKTRDLR